jgi:hypothetical protein
MKQCSKCGETKEKEAFSKDSTRKDNLDPQCKTCKASYVQTRNNARSTRPKRCTDCEETKEPSHFYSHCRSGDGLAHVCKACDNSRRRDNHLKQYGLTHEGYLALLKHQEGGCKICRVKAKSQRFGVLHVDHCHSTGDVRGLLCTNCNTSLGGFKDDTALLIQAIKYLEEA